MHEKQAKAIIKKLGLKHKEFSLLLGHNINYVTDFKRHGVSNHMRIILNLIDALLKLDYDKSVIIDILKTIKKQEKP